MSSAADIIRERQVAARRALKGDNAPTPASTRKEAAVTLDAAAAADGTTTAPPSEEDAVIDEFLRRTRANGDGAGLAAFCPFGILDLFLFIALFVGIHFWLLHSKNINLLPHVWHYIGPHYDHKYEPGYEAPELDPKVWDL